MRWRFWSNILAVAYKETQVLRHDAAFITVVTAQPIMMLFLFGACLSNEPANVPWAGSRHLRSARSAWAAPLREGCARAPRRRTSGPRIGAAECAGRAEPD